MACYIMLALAPMIVVTLKVISVVPFLKAKTNEIVEGQVTQLIGSQSGPGDPGDGRTRRSSPGQGTSRRSSASLVVSSPPAACSCRSRTR